MQQQCLRGWLLLGLLLVASRSPAISIHLDYSYDTGNFFGAGNPQGAAAGSQARAALETAATYFSTILTDTFSSIQKPPDFHSTISNGHVSWQWNQTFNHPSTGDQVTLTNQTIPADQYIIYAGARSIGGNTLGIGGPGGYGWSSSPVGTFGPAEIGQINQIQENFRIAVEQRGEPEGEFARWGGTIAFDRDPNTPWHYDHTTAVVAGRSDLFSVAIHELAHALGFGSSEIFTTFVQGSSFTGTHASLEYGSSVPLAPGGNHWAEGIISSVFGTSIPQEVAMDPTVTTGTRKRWTELDAAALRDIGWSVANPPGLAGDYNNNGVVDAADYTVWRDSRGKNVAAGSGADGDLNGTIGNGDYAVWRNNFGSIAGAASGANLLAMSASRAAVVPEPSTLVFVVMAMVSAIAPRRRVR